MHKKRNIWSIMKRMCTLTRFPSITSVNNEIGCSPSLVTPSVQSKKPAPLRRLTRYNLSFNRWDGNLIKENKLQKFVCDCLSPRYESCTRSCCRGSNLGPSDEKAGVLTTRPSFSIQCNDVTKTIFCTVISQKRPNRCDSITIPDPKTHSMSLVTYLHGDSMSLQLFDTDKSRRKQKIYRYIQ